MAEPTVANRCLDGIFWATVKIATFGESLIIAVALVSIAWATIYYFTGYGLSFPHFGSNLPVIGPITKDSPLLAAGAAFFALVTLSIFHWRDNTLNT